MSIDTNRIQGKDEEEEEEEASTPELRSNDELGALAGVSTSTSLSQLMEQRNKEQIQAAKTGEAGVYNNVPRRF